MCKATRVSFSNPIIIELSSYGQTVAKCEKTAHFIKATYLEQFATALRTEISRSVAEQLAQSAPIAALETWTVCLDEVEPIAAGDSATGGAALDGTDAIVCLCRRTVESAQRHRWDVAARLDR